MTISIKDRILSILFYLTFGIFGLIWLIYTNLVKERLSSFLKFNLYQSIFIGAVLSIVTAICELALNFLKLIPFIGKYFVKLYLFLNGTPIYYGFTLYGLFVVIVLAYLAIICLLGKAPKMPYVSNIIKSNFGE